MRTHVLSDAQINRVHDVSLTILEEVGVVVPHDEMLRRFAAAGAQVDLSRQLVRIPRALVADSLAKAGKQFTLYGRNPDQRAEYGYGKRNYNTIAGEASWLEEIGGTRRFATMQDVATASRFTDALQHVNVVGAMSDPHETPVAWRSVEVVATMIRNTTKPLHFWFHDRASAAKIMDLAVALRGSAEEATAKPLFYAFLEPISPLRFPFNGVDLLFETARLNLPVSIGPMAQTGLSAPCSLAGTMAQENAEILAGICITQLVNPGTPVCYGGICHAFDMGSTQMIFAGPEQAIFGVAMTQMGKSYGLPVYINVGLTDSKRPDAQAGLESGITLAMGAAAGADTFGHMGISGVDQASSLDILVMQDEVISYVESTMRELDFSDEAFGLDVTRAVGPGGNFINTDHTVDHFRKELWFPKLLDREYYQAWQDAGATSMEDRCRARKEAILGTHTPEPVSAELDAAMTKIVGEAKRELVKG